MKVLVIDDDFHVLRIVEDRLKAENFQVLKAADGIEGLRLVYDFHPDVVLLDIMMPTIDGHSVLLCIKKDEKIQNIPVIMMTAKRERADVTQAAAAGATDYIVKPIDFRLMVKKIYEAVHALPPKEKDPEEVPLNIQSMAMDLQNLSFEMDAVAASAGLESEPMAPRAERVMLNIKVDAEDGTAVLHLKGMLREDDKESIMSEIKRLTASGMSRFIINISDLQSLDIAEVMILKEVLDKIAVSLYERRLVETDSKRRRFLRHCNIQMDHPLFETLAEALRSF